MMTSLQSLSRSWMRSTAMLTAVMLCLMNAAQGQSQLPKQYKLADLKVLQKSFVKLAEDLRPSVVAVHSYQIPDPTDVHGRWLRIPVSQGSGFVIDRDGYIATNQHVLEEANAFTVILDNGLKYDASVVARDGRSDLAVLKIEAKGLTPVRWGNLSKVRVGQWTFAVGNPFGLANDHGRMSVTVGTVSQLNRDLTRRLIGSSNSRYYGHLIESSSAINPGHSGGPLFNIDGEVIGIITAIETSSGVSEGAGFAIPVDHNTRHILDTLKRGEQVRYGFLGVQISDTDPHTSDRRILPRRVYSGAEISVLVSDGPAAKAGLKSGDVVVEVDGVAVESADHLVRLVSFAPVGKRLSITFIRRNVKRKAVVTLADRRDFLPVAIRQ